jgi:hypothetical protein
LTGGRLELAGPTRRCGDSSENLPSSRRSGRLPGSGHVPFFAAVTANVAAAVRRSDAGFLAQPLAQLLEFLAQSLAEHIPFRRVGGRAARVCVDVLGVTICV